MAIVTWRRPAALRVSRAGRPSPLSALLRGVVGGLAGSLAQDLFFAATKKLAPATPKDVFVPPEREQHGEQATQTVARRFVEELMQRGPLQNKERAGRIVHYAFGAAWGGVYGLLAASSPAAAKLPGGLTHGVFVWAVSDDLLLPAFRLAAPPKAYPAKVHAYAIAAHLVYGACVSAVFALTAKNARWRS